MNSYLPRLIAGTLCLLVAGVPLDHAMAADTIYACAHKNLGDVRVVEAPGQCLKSEYELSWEDGLELRQQINELLGRMSAIESALGVLNEAPTVVANDDQTILVSMTAALGGSAEDDGLLSPLSFLWEELSSSPSVFIDDPHSLTTSVSFAAPGEYDFRLSVSDGAITVSDELRIIVYKDNSPPVITKNQDPLIIPAYRVRQGGYWVMYCPQIDLDVTVDDDNEPADPSFDWSIDSTSMYPSLYNYNETNIVFTSTPSDKVEWPLHMAAKHLRIGLPSSYLPHYLEASLTLAVSDGYHSVEDQLIVRCDLRASPAPVVEAGDDQTIDGTPISGGYLCQVPLNGLAEDDGRPEPLNISWGISNYNPLGNSYWYASGSFNPSNSAQATANLTVRERYIGSGYVLPSSVTFTLRLRATDGYSTTDDFVSVLCNKP